MSTAYDYYPAVLHALDVFSQGETLTEACDQANIGIATFERYVKADPELQNLYVEAERRGHDAMADALIHIDNHRVHGQSDAKMAKVISDNIKWLLSKRDTKRFGDKIEVQHNVTLDKAIVGALEAAKRRAIAYEEPKLIEAEYVEVDEDEAILAEILS